MARIEGESAQQKGADGARRAKRWLESTTRVNAQWVNPEPPAVPKLRFAWPHGQQNFSFDLAGTLKYGQFDGQAFYAECKNYDLPSDLATHYEKFLAQCYVAFSERPYFSDHFMWIAWSPHSITKWSTLRDEATVRTAVIKHRARVFGEDIDEDEAGELVNAVTIAAVSQRLWLIILSERQEELVISAEHRGVIEKFEIEKAG